MDKLDKVGNDGSMIAKEMKDREDQLFPVGVVWDSKNLCPDDSPPEYTFHEDLLYSVFCPIFTYSFHLSYYFNHQKPGRRLIQRHKY